MPAATMAAQVRLNRVTPSYCRVVLDHPPLNLMGPELASREGHRIGMPEQAG
jgi:hypothetical protein